MRPKSVTAFVLAALASVSTLRAADVRLGGDPDPWRLAGDETSGGVRTLEFLRPGRSFGNSPEILIVTRAQGDDASTAAEEHLSDRRSACDDGHYEFAFSGWEDTAYRWEPRGCDAPDAELDEVGRVFVSGSEVVRITVRLRDTGRLSFWSRWIASSNATYAAWRGSLFGSGSARRPAPADDTLSPDSCADDDLDCLLALQRRQLAALEATRGDGGRAAAGGSAGAASRREAASASGCCSVPEIRQVQLQRDNPAAARTADVTRFLSTDTYVYAVADLRGNQAGSVVTFRWVRLDGQGGERELVSRDVTIESGNSWVYGSFFYNGLTPVGRYRVDISFDGVLAGSREFSVAAGSAFG